MKSVRNTFFAALLLVTLACTLNAFGQAGVGELTGVVTDSSRSIVPNAGVKLTNAATGQTREAKTTSTGDYRFTALPIVGTYTLTVTAPGFETYVATNLVLTVGTVTSQDVALSVGSAQQTVTVTGAAEEQVQTDTAAVSQLIDASIWKNSPLETRSQNDFINLVAGATPDSGTGRGAAVSGARTGTGNFLVEGLDNNDQGQGGSGTTYGSGGAVTTISPDAIQEYRVLTHDYPAEYGRTGGFATDTVLKSGTNKWHGSLFEYNRIQALAANSWFSNHDGLKDHLVRNQFGGSVGGPIKHDKTFFYTSVEIHHLRTGAPTTDPSLTPQFLQFVDSGAFETFMESDPAGFCVMNTGAACPGAFPGTAHLGSTFKALYAAEPSAVPAGTQNPTNSASGLLTSGLAYPVNIFANATLINTSSLNQNRATFKLDHQLTSRDQLSFVYLIDQVASDSSLGGGSGAFGPPIDNIGGSQHFGANWTHNFSSSLLNEFRAGYLRHVSNFVAPGTAGVPAIYTIDELDGSFGGSSGLPQFFTENQFEYADSVTKIIKAHTLKAGFQYIRTRNGSSFFNDVNGSFVFNGSEDLVTDGAFGQEADTALFGGPAYGSFYEVSASVDPTTGLAPDPYRGYRANEYATYFQDDWKITPRLTVNAGIRWEYFGPPHNFKKGVDSNVYFGTPGTPVAPTNAAGNANAFFPTSSFAGEVQGATFIQKNSNIWNKDTNNFAPRFGISYDLTGQGKLVLRAGFGIGYDRLYNNVYENIRFNSPHFADNNFGALLNGVAAAPAYQPGLYAIPFTGNNQLAAFGGKPTPRHIDQNLVTAYYEQFHYGFQYEVAKGYVLETDYIGTLGRKLVGLKDINNFDGRVACTAGNLQPACQGVAFPTNRINKIFNSDNYRSNGYNSNYNGLQVSLRKGFSNGLQLLANYTYSKAMDEISDVFTQRNGNTGPTDVLNPSKDYGPADFDLRHNVVITANYATPWKKNNLLLGGWTFSPIISLQSGTPIALSDSVNDPNKDGRLNERPQFALPGSVKNAITHAHSPATEYLKPGSFVPVGVPAISSSGSQIYVCANGALWCDSPLGRNSITGPRNLNVDFGAIKRFSIGERNTVTFEANFFNLFNHPVFSNPDGNIQDGTFGTSLSTANSARVTQLALRYDF
jgi:hypothetical protein